MATPKSKPAEEPDEQTTPPQTPADVPPAEPPADQAPDTPPAEDPQAPPAEPQPEPGPDPEADTITLRMRVRISGTRNGQDWPAPGETLDVPEEEAMNLIANGYATHADEEETATAETATIETATPAGRRSIKASLDKGAGGQ